MNHALTDPFILAQDYPEVLSGSLSWFHLLLQVLLLTIIESGIATCIRFNRRGDLLASGRVHQCCAHSEAQIPNA